MLVLTIVMVHRSSSIDIMIKPEQRIIDVLNILAENGQIAGYKMAEKIFIRSWRRGEYLNVYSTFQQSGIFYGDILYVEVEKDE